MQIHSLSQPMRISDKSRPFRQLSRKSHDKVSKVFAMSTFMVVFFTRVFMITIYQLRSEECILNQESPFDEGSLVGDDEGWLNWLKALHHDSRNGFVNCVQTWDWPIISDDRSTRALGHQYEDRGTGSRRQIWRGENWVIELITSVPTISQAAL